jgi:hypothetical protein
MLLGQCPPPLACSNNVYTLQRSQCRPMRRRQLSGHTQQTCSLPHHDTCHRARCMRRYLLQVIRRSVLCRPMRRPSVGGMPWVSRCVITCSQGGCTASVRGVAAPLEQPQQQELLPDEGPRKRCLRCGNSAPCSTSQCARLSQTAGCTAMPASVSSGWRPSRQECAPTACDLLARESADGCTHQTSDIGAVFMLIGSRPGPWLCSLRNMLCAAV